MSATDTASLRCQASTAQGSPWGRFCNCQHRAKVEITGTLTTFGKKSEHDVPNTTIKVCGVHAAVYRKTGSVDLEHGNSLRDEARILAVREERRKADDERMAKWKFNLLYTGYTSVADDLGVRSDDLREAAKMFKAARIDIKAILADPAKRERLIAGVVQFLHNIEINPGNAISFEAALEIVRGALPRKD